MSTGIPHRRTPGAATSVPAVRHDGRVNLPADELPWCAQPQDCLGLVQLVELAKAPVEWY